MPSILSIGVSGLNSSKRALTTTGHNIANVNTDGYSRQRVIDGTREPERSGAGWQGTGVRATSIERAYNAFVVSQVRSTNSSVSELTTYSSYANAIDDVYADPAVGLAPVVQDFFNAAQGVADDPSSVASRQLMLSNAQTMVDRFHYLDARNQDMRHQIDRDMDNTIDSINSLAENIAQINAAIIDARAGSNNRPPNDLLDQRDQMLDTLSQQVDITTFEQDDGAMNVFIGNGQTLVIGNDSRSLETRANALDPSRKEVVYADGSAAGQVISGALSGGELGGMLRFRGELLDTSQNQLGLIATGIAERVNQQQNLGLDLNGVFGANFFTQAAIPTRNATTNTGTGSVTASLTDVNDVVPSDYQLRYDGAFQYSLIRLSDNTTTTINTGGGSPYVTAPIDGFTLSISNGAVVGDSMLIQPTRQAADHIGLLLNDTRQIAAAAPLRAAEATDANGNPLNSGNAAITQPATNSTANLPLAGVGGDIMLTFDPNAGGAGVPGFNVSGGLSTTLLYDPASDAAGKTFTLASRGGAEFQLSGTPATGDSFVIADNSAGNGDNRNALSLAGLQGVKGLLGGTASFQDGYSQLVSDVGTKARHAEINAESQRGLLRQAQAQREEVSGVNLDEEAANLLKYQQAYQASAQVISAAQTLFDTLIAATRR